MNPTALNTPVVSPAAAAAPRAGYEPGAVSWAAVLAGAAAAAALSLVLLILGMGLGLSSVSPWAFEGVSAETFGWSTIAWLAFMAIASSGLGGYLTGRLRTRWPGVHADETYFRDTAHGFLSWAIATLLTAALLTSAIGAILGTGAKAAGAVAGTAVGTAGGIAGAVADDASTGQDGANLQYWVDSLLRQIPDAAASQRAPAQRAPMPVDSGDDAAMAMGQPGNQTGNQGATGFRSRGGPMAGGTLSAEISGIIRHGLAGDALDSADSEYIAQRIAAHTGLSQAQAQARLEEVETRMRSALAEAETTAREAADEARKASAYAALWLFITLLIGAFTASLLATFGGRQRDL